MPPFIRPLVFILCLVPLGELGLRLALGKLGANPVEAVLHHTGDWTLRLLLITLAITPLRELSGRAWLMRLRRMLGLYTFFYACLHVLAYVVLEQFFDWQAILADFVERPYITVGMLAFAILVPLAVTSTNAMMRRLGQRWQQLHRLVYVAAIAGVLHFLWLVKAVALLEPLIYAGILAVLLGWRARKIKSRSAKA